MRSKVLPTILIIAAFETLPSLTHSLSMMASHDNNSDETQANMRASLDPRLIQKDWDSRKAESMLRSSGE
jgi:hypothetical protein